MIRWLATRGRWWRRRRRQARLQRHLARSRARVARYQDFADFRRTAATTLPHVARTVRALDYFRAYYAFAGCPGGANGGIDDRLVEAILGEKPFDATRDFSRRGPGGQPSTRVHSERGASLAYEYQDTGRVLVFLYPATTKRRRPLEDFIILAELGSPARLARPRVLRRHLRWLAAYMASTSLDGAITLPQCVRVGWLWLWHRRYEHRRLRPRRLWIGLGWLVKWVAMVALSGSLLYVIQRVWPLPDKVTPAVQRAAAIAHQDQLNLQTALAHWLPAAHGSACDAASSPREARNVAANGCAT